MDKMTYAEAGVDVTVEAKASRIMYEASRQTYKNRKGKIGNVLQLFDDFSGLKVFPLGGLSRGTMGSFGLDGAGTKTEISCRVNDYKTIAFDLVAMLTDDAVIRGGEPALIGSVLDIKSLGKDERYLSIIRELARGYVAAADDANVAIFNGEIAQMGALISGYGEFPFNWGGVCMWFGKRNRLISGAEIGPGFRVMVFREPGFRCNGLSMVRRVYVDKYGPEWHKERYSSRTGFDIALGDAVMQPSKIYSHFMVYLHGGYEGERKYKIYGAAHITGGGLPEKIGRMLRPSGCGVQLTNLFAPGEFVSHCQKVGGITDDEAYKAWNMGQGMAIVVEHDDVASIVKAAKAFGIEAQDAGRVVAEPGVWIRSMGAENPSAMLRY